MDAHETISKVEKPLVLLTFPPWHLFRKHNTNENHPIGWFFRLIAEMRSVLHDLRRREWAWSATEPGGRKRECDKGEIRRVGSAPRVRDRGDYIFEWDFQMSPTKRDVCLVLSDLCLDTVPECYG